MLVLQPHTRHSTCPHKQVYSEICRPELFLPMWPGRRRGAPSRGWQGAQGSGLRIAFSCGRLPFLDRIAGLFGRAGAAREHRAGCTGRAAGERTRHWPCAIQGPAAQGLRPGEQPRRGHGRLCLSVIPRRGGLMLFQHPYSTILLAIAQVFFGGKRRAFRRGVPAREQRCSAALLAQAEPAGGMGIAGKGGALRCY